MVGQLFAGYLKIETFFGRDLSFRQSLRSIDFDELKNGGQDAAEHAVRICGFRYKSWLLKGSKKKVLQFV